MQNFRIEDFLSKLCKDTFAGYATTQIKKAQGLNKKIVNPLPIEKKDILSFCHILNNHNSIPLPDWLKANNYKAENCGLINIPHAKGTYALFHDTENTLGYKGIVQKVTSNEVSVSSIPKNQQEKAYMYFNKEGYSTYCKEHKEYWEWVEKRNNERYNTNQRHGKNYDSKNMMHTIRLLQSAEQILISGKLNIKVNNREELLAIKSGNKSYEDLIDMAEILMKSIEKNYITTQLFSFPNKDKIEKLLISIRTELYS